MASLALFARDLRALSRFSERPFVGRICEDAQVSEEERAREILLVRGRPDHWPLGFRAYLVCESATPPTETQDAYVIGPSLHYLAEGDVVRLDPQRRTVMALYRRASPSNSLLVTERCDNFCLMCSQPPREQDDSWVVEELLREVIPLLSPDTRQLGITGGEPTLLGERFLALIEALQGQLPRTALHVLSNGRAFANASLARRLGRLGHSDLMVGIPLYGDLPEQHDYVVQARGAFDETIRGILELKRAGVPVEVRFVIHRETVQRLPEFASFLARNLCFVDHVALMGLEQVGFAKTNLDGLWVDPLDVQDELVSAVHTLQRAGMSVSLYGQQLCVLPAALHAVARKAISDWKNVYAPECAGCRLQEQCGGFFASSVERKSRGITPQL